MYQVLSDLKMLERFDLEVTDVIASGYQGSWVTIESGKAKLTSTQAGVSLAYPVWTEELRTGAQGYSPDTVETSKVTVLSGRHRALTDQYDHATTQPAVGDLLYAGTGTRAASVGVNTSSGTEVNGILTNTAYGSGVAVGILPVAICKKAPFLYKPVHGGTARYVIEIQVL